MTTEGSVYQRKDGRWVAQYRDLNGKIRYLYRKTKQDAKRALREALQDRDEGFLPPEKVTFGAYIDGWMEVRKADVSYRTWRVQNSLVNNRIKPYVGDEKLCKLSAKDVRRLYAALLVDGLSPATVRNVHVILKQSLRDAVREKKIKTSPIDDVKPPKPEHKQKDVLSPDELSRLLEAVAGDKYEGIFYLCSFVGLRIGEALAATVSSVDFEAGTISIDHTLYNGETCDPKTISSRATLALPQSVLHVLSRHAQDRVDGFLFATSNGKPIDVSNFYKWVWRPALRKANLPETITPHLLRHGTGSYLLHANIPITVTSTYLRHSSPLVTMRTYAHELKGTSGMAADALDQTLASTPPRRLRAV